MKVRIVSYEDINAWILGKFARRLKENLIDLGVQVDINSVPDPTADINHHIIYLGYKETNPDKIETLMITHIDDIRKLKLLKKQLSNKNKVGVCMSRYTMEELMAAGISRERLCFINPAHDNIMEPRPIVIGITSKVQPDGCKREDFLLKLCDHIDPKLFSFKIMGAGWERIVGMLGKKGFTIDYHNQFDYEKYKYLVPNFDYYLYMGQDEGSMGYLDALAAGVKTIVTPQGYHLDAKNGITHSFNEIGELKTIFDEISRGKKDLIEAMAGWKWSDYAIKHLDLWHFLINKDFESSKSYDYKDGVNVLVDKESNIAIGSQNYKMKLYVGAVKRTFFKVKSIKTFSSFFSKLKNFIKINFMKMII